MRIVSPIHKPAEPPAHIAQVKVEELKIARSLTISSRRPKKKVSSTNKPAANAVAPKPIYAAINPVSVAIPPRRISNTAAIVPQNIGVGAGYANHGAEPTSSVLRAIASQTKTADAAPNTTQVIRDLVVIFFFLPISNHSLV